MNEIFTAIMVLLSKYWLLATLFSLLLVGMAIGLMLRRWPGVFKPAERVCSALVYVLLFLLGLSAGNNRQVVGQLGQMGYEALLISVFAVIGSVIVSYVVYIIFFRNAGSKE